MMKYDQYKENLLFFNIFLYLLLQHKNIFTNQTLDFEIGKIVQTHWKDLYIVVCSYILGSNCLVFFEKI